MCRYSIKIITMKRNITLFAMGCAVVAALAFASCNKFGGSQTVPAYIRIDSIKMDTMDYFIYGANTSNFADAWVYVDDQIHGCFELPATIPVLAKGNHKVSVYPGIKVDGRRGTRSAYLFCKPAEYRNLTLTEDCIETLNPIVRYYESDILQIPWKEDFETGSSLLPLSDSDTSLMRVSGAEAWRSDNSFYSGKIVLPPDSLDFYLASSEMTFHSEFNDQTPCMLEMDYKCNDTFFVGLIYKKSNTIERWPIVKVLPTDKKHAVPQRWNKIYINIGHVMKRETDASYFKLYFTSDLTVHDDLGEHPYAPINETRYYYFDNLKVLYR